MATYEFFVKVNILVEADDENEARSEIESWLADNVWEYGEIEVVS